MHSNDATFRLEQVEQLMLDLIANVTGEAAQAAAGHFSAGGSRVRAKLALHACHALNLKTAEAVSIAAACELLHNASLVHDDLQDRDVQRRGRPAIWRSHGEATAICVGDLMLSASYAALAGIGSGAAPLLSRMHARVAAVIRGQCEDLRLQGAVKSTLDTYKRVACAKSGPLLVLPLELALARAGLDGAIATAVDAGSLFAIGYQISDDLADVADDALNEELNIVAVLAASGEPQPDQAARELAIRCFEQARAAAANLPSGAGELLAGQARRQAAALADAAVAA